MQASAIDRWWETLGQVAAIALVGLAALAPRIEPSSPGARTMLEGKPCIALQGTAQDRVPRCATVAMAASVSSTP